MAAEQSAAASPTGCHVPAAVSAEARGPAVTRAFEGAMVATLQAALGRASLLLGRSPRRAAGPARHPAATPGAAAGAAGAPAGNPAARAGAARPGCLQMARPRSVLTRSAALAAPGGPDGLHGAGRAASAAAAAGAVASAMAPVSAALLEQLDYEHEPSVMDNLTAIVASVVVSDLPFRLGWKAPAGWPAPQVLEVCLAIAIFLAVRAFATTLLVEPHYQAKLVSPEAAAAPDSEFLTLRGATGGDVRVHFFARAAGGAGGRLTGPAAAAASAAPAARVLLAFHGFGANAFSFTHAALPALADRLGAMAIAFDAPGFGLTERPVHPDEYDTPAVAGLGLRLLDALALGPGGSSSAGGSADGSIDGGGGALAAGGSVGGSVSTGAQRILVGHSLGGTAAATAAAASPRGHVAALVLIAPAILAPRGGLGPAAAAAPGAPPAPTPPAPWPLRVALTLWRGVVGWLAAVVLLGGQPFILMLLRALVRSRKFWERGLRASWHDTSRLSDAIVDGYRKPGIIKDWDTGLIKFLSARLVPAWLQWAGPGRKPDPAAPPPPAPPPALAPLSLAALAAAGVPILIIHGKQDRLVPFGNSKKLQAMLPGCELVELEGCGHVPHEERPGAVADAVADFVARRVPPP